MNDFDLLSHVLYDNIQTKMLISSSRDISKDSSSSILSNSNVLLQKYSPSSKGIINNTALSNSSTSNATTTTNNSTSNSQMMSTSQLNWLTDYTNIILGDNMQQQQQKQIQVQQQIEVYKYGRPIGLVIAWLLCHHQLGTTLPTVPYHYSTVLP